MLYTAFEDDVSAIQWRQWSNTGMVERGVESTTGDLSVYPLRGLFYFPWVLKGTDGF